MASLGGSAETHSATAAVSTRGSLCKVKRTEVILNYPRRPDAAHFKVLQWNVLADGLAQNGDFCRTPPECLEWEYRKELLLQEILEADADIICLQELNHFDELNSVLAGYGYAGAFREKHASPALKYEYPPDGMAVFYRRDRFRVAPGGVEGRSFTDDSTGREQSQGFLQVLLYDMVVGRQLLVVTTHLKAKDGAECEEVRLGQARQLLHHVEATWQRLRREGGGGGGGDGGKGACGGGATEGVGNGSSGNGAAAVAAAGKQNGANGGSCGARAAAAATPVAATNGNGAGCHGGSGGGGGGHGSGSGGVTVVIAGDFNTMPGSKTCQAFRQHPLGLQSLWEQRPLDSSIISGSGSDLELTQQQQHQQREQQQQQQQQATQTQTQQQPQTPVRQQQTPVRQPHSTHSVAGPGPGPPQHQEQRQERLTAAAAALVSSSDCGGGGGGGCSSGGSAEFSTWKFRVKGESKRISDYIWFTPSGAAAAGCGGALGGGGGGGGGGALVPLTRWRMLTEEEIGPGALPSAAYGSDHVSLCCGFEWDVDADLEWAPQPQRRSRAEAEDWG